MEGLESELEYLFLMMWAELSSFTMKNKSKKAAVIDAVSIAPSVYAKAFEKKKIQTIICSSRGIY